MGALTGGDRRDGATRRRRRRRQADLRADAPAGRACARTGRTSTSGTWTACAGPPTGAALVVVETLSNPNLAVADLPAICEVAHAAGARVLVDNTVATPVNCRPLEWGADMVMHSATKYLNGHSDVLAGVAAGPEALMSEVRTSALELGATLSPDSAWLVRRGIRTLHLRVERAGQNAMRIAEFLEAHPRVIRVVYPGLASHPAYDVARRILDGYGAMLAFEVEGGRPAGEAVMDRVRLCVRATSLGGVETCVSHPASTSHRQLTEAELDGAGHPSRRPPPGGRDRGRQRSDRGPRAGASVTPERRVSPWWMLLPALLFVLNFIGGLTQDTGDRANAVYDLVDPRRVGCDRGGAGRVRGARGAPLGAADRRDARDPARAAPRGARDGRDRARRDPGVRGGARPDLQRRRAAGDRADPQPARRPTSGSPSRWPCSCSSSWRLSPRS